MTTGWKRWICLAWLLLIPFTGNAATPIIAAGDSHTIAVHTDGTLRTWGNDRSGQLGSGRATNSNTPGRVIGVPTLKPGADSLAAGFASAFAIAGDGSLWAWGANDTGQVGDGTTIDRPTPVRVSGLSDVMAVACGQAHSIAVTADGSVWTWGYNGYGQLGDGTLNGRTTPARVNGLTGVVAVAAGVAHTVALRSDGSVWAWGHNSFGQLGNGATVSSSAPVQVTGLIGITRIAAGPFHTLALKSDGTVWAWGHNGSGQLGDGTRVNRSAPLQVPGIAAVRIAAGGQSSGGYVVLAPGLGTSLAVKSDGSVWSWGFSQSGAGDLRPPEPAPYLTGVVEIKGGDSTALRNDGRVLTLGPTPEVPGIAGVVAIAAPNISGDGFTLAGTQDGALYSWGINSRGQIGIDQLLSRSTPITVAGLTGVTQVAAGSSHTVAIRSDGTVWAWGANHSAQLGYRSAVGLSGTPSASQPVQVSGISQVVQVAAGSGHTVALKSDGTVWAWGDNSMGQLGDGTSGPSPIGAPDGPRQVPGLAGVLKVAAGDLHTLAVRSDGSVWGWGNNQFGQLGAAANASCNRLLDNRPVSCVKSPQQVPGISAVIDVATSAGHTLALRSDGTLWGWGDNSTGELGDGTTTSRSAPAPVVVVSSVVKISAGGYFCTPACGGGAHSMALKTDGSVWTWGYNGYGQLGNGTQTNRSTPVPLVGLSGAISISAGLKFSAAVKSDGTVWTWGDNEYGQLGDGTYETRREPVLAVNETVNGPLDLIPEIPNNIPSSKIPPFFLATYKSGDLSAITLSADIRGITPSGTFAAAGNFGTFAAGYNVYVAANVPSRGYFQLDSNNRWSVLTWPMADFLRGVALDSQNALVRAQIFQNMDLSAYIGTSILVGYGTSPDEMVASARYRTIYTVTQPQ